MSQDSPYLDQRSCGFSSATASILLHQQQQHQQHQRQLYCQHQNQSHQLHSSFHQPHPHHSRSLFSCQAQSTQQQSLDDSRYCYDDLTFHQQHPSQQQQGAQQNVNLFSIDPHEVTSSRSISNYANFRSTNGSVIFPEPSNSDLFKLHQSSIGDPAAGPLVITTLDGSEQQHLALSTNCVNYNLFVDNQNCNESFFGGNYTNSTAGLLHNQQHSSQATHDLSFNANNNIDNIVQLNKNCSIKYAQDNRSNRDESYSTFETRPPNNQIQPQQSFDSSYSADLQLSNGLSPVNAKPDSVRSSDFSSSAGKLIWSHQDREPCHGDFGVDGQALNINTVSRAMDYTNEFRHFAKDNSTSRDCYSAGLATDRGVMTIHLRTDSGDSVKVLQMSNNIIPDNSLEDEAGAKSMAQAGGVRDGSGKKKKGTSRKDKLDRRHSSESPRRLHSCPVCGREFSEKFNMKRHMQVHDNSRPKYTCQQCARTFAWKDNFVRHQKASHNPTYSSQTNF